MTLNLIGAKLFENPTRGPKNKERTRKRDGQTDRQTDRKTTELKTICLPILTNIQTMK